MDDKLTKQLQELINMKKKLVANLNAKGIVASEDEILETLVPKVLYISQTQGDLTLGFKTITEDGNYFPSNDGLDAYSSVSVNVMSDNNAMIKYLDLRTNSREFRLENKGNLPSYAWYKITAIRNVILKDCEEIGEHAFNGCTRMITLDTDKTIKKIGQYAFNGCTSLESEIILDDSITEIPMYTFYNCRKLKVNLPKKIENVGSYAYQSCENFFCDELPETLHSVGVYAFANCINLTAKIMPIITNMENYAFNSSGIQFKEIPSGCILSNYAFNNCKSLTEMKFNNDGIIPVSSFANCINLEKIEIGAGITNLASSAFRACSKLKKIICHAITPPTLVLNAINTCPIEEIYVPASALEEYKSATNWSTYADKMIAIEGE